MPDKKKILLASLIADVKEYCLYDFIASAENIYYENYNILLIDNSADISFYKKIENQYPYLQVRHIRPSANIVHTLAECQEYARRQAIESGSDLFLLECDVFPPRNILNILASYNSPVVSASYFVKDKNGGVPVLCVQEFENYGVTKISKLFSHEKSFFVTGTGLRRVSMTHLGCTLIENEALQHLNFRSQERINETATNSTFSDTYFFADCAKKNIPVFLDTNIICEHRWTSWDRIIKLN